MTKTKQTRLLNKLRKASNVIQDFNYTGPLEVVRKSVTEQEINLAASVIRRLQEDVVNA